MTTTSTTTSGYGNILGLEFYIALSTCLLLVVHFSLRSFLPPQHAAIPLWILLAGGGVPLVYDLLLKALRLEFGSDHLAGISIVTASLLNEPLAGALVVLMLSGGKTLEAYAVGRASDTLKALAKRMPTTAHLKKEGETIHDIAIQDLKLDDMVVIYPHEICPTDGVVIEGHGRMNEAFLTGEPFDIAKTPGSETISGALNGDTAITIRVLRRAIDSRYAKIMRVMQEAEKNPPRIRRIGDRLGALYTPLALTLAVLAWYFSGEVTRFLAVLVIATPCPLLIAIPIGVIGAISLCAHRGIVIKNPAILEELETCRSIIFDKTGTLTYGKPEVTTVETATGFSEDQVMQLAGSLEQYSKHPLASAILKKVRDMKLSLVEVTSISEPPGQGMCGWINTQKVEITGRGHLKRRNHLAFSSLPPIASGAECLVLVDDHFAARLIFHDAPREDSRSFVGHLKKYHQFSRVMLLSGDRESEVGNLARHVGITEIHSNKTPEQKLEIVREITEKIGSIYVGDGINDAPALAAATIGIAFGPNSDITSEAADAVIMEPSMKRIDDLFHIARRMRKIVLQSAVGGMALSILGMLAAAAGYIPPVLGAVLQEVIDLVAVINALRITIPVKQLSDYDLGNIKSS
jgi:heavy metal translocating P-type ATPase